MNYAIKINALVESLWPQSSTHTDLNSIQLNILTFDSILKSLTINELYQILELCSQKALFMVLQKGDLLMQNFIENKKFLLVEVNKFFMTWIHPRFDYNLKRSYDECCVEMHIERSISRFLGRILKEISKQNTHQDWEVVSSYLMELGEKSKYFQVLVLSGYFEKIEELENMYEEYEQMREFFRNFEYEIVSKVIKLAISNVACCKQTLEVLEIEYLQMGLSIENDQNVNNQRKMTGNNEDALLNSGKLKYLKYNFELIKKIINFNYELYLGENQQEEEEQSHETENNHLQRRKHHKSKNQTKLSSFPDYIIKPFLEDVFLEQLYEISILLLSFNSNQTKTKVSFADIILDLINKIIKTRVTEYQLELKEKFVRDILNGQTKLMRKILKNQADFNYLLKILKGNLKLLKNTELIDLILFQQVQEWLWECFKVVQFVLNAEEFLNLENYFAYKAMTLGKEIVYQTIIYSLPSTHAGLSREIISFGLKIQQNFLTKFIADTHLLTNHKFIVQCYSMEDLREKRDRYFLNLKILSQIYLPTFNKLLKQLFSSINSIEKASKLLFFMSYIATSELMAEESFYYVCKYEDVKQFKKLAIGNCFILANELMKEISNGSITNNQVQDVIFLYIERVLYEHLEHKIMIETTLQPCDVHIKTQNIIFNELTSHSSLLAICFTWILKIIRLKIEKCKDLADIDSFFKDFIWYLRILVEKNEFKKASKIASIQCDLLRELIEFKNACRSIMPQQTRKYLGQIYLLLRQEPEITMEQSYFKSRLIVPEIKSLLELLSSNPNDWMGICYEIVGFFKAIDQESTYVQVINVLGVDFVQKICLSCIEIPNEQKIKLFAYFTNSLMNLSPDIKIKNLRFWFPYLAPIFSSWTQLFKIMSTSNFKEQEWSEYSYVFIENLLTNSNLNFYLIKYSSALKQVFTHFIQSLINFLNFCLNERMTSYQQKDNKLFRVIKRLFEGFAEYFFVQENIGNCSGFYTLISKLLVFATSQLKSINNRKSFSVRYAIHSVRPIKTILDELTDSIQNGKFSHKSFQQDISTFFSMEKGSFKELQKEMELTRSALDKCMRYSYEKVKKSDLDLLQELSESIYQTFKQKGLQIVPFTK